VKSWESEAVLVTGGCGFLGSYLAEELVRAGAEVTILDNLETGTLDNIAHVREQVEFIREDMLSLEVCLEASAGVQTVMNLVGKTEGIGYSKGHQGEMLYHNAVTHLNMLEAARRNEVKRYLLVSSSCVYPDDAPIPTPELPVITGSPEIANRGYGWAKRVAELQADYYHDEYEMNIAICRPFNPYGGRYIWRGEAYSHVLPSLVKNIMDGQNPLVVWGSGQQRRNFLHALDTVKLMMILAKDGPYGIPVNIGYEDEVTIEELVKLICKTAKKNPTVTFDTTKPEGRFRKCADATLLREVTNSYKPEVSLEDGIVEMIDWYKRTFRK